MQLLEIWYIEIVISNNAWFYSNLSELVHAIRYYSRPATQRVKVDSFWDSEELHITLTGKKRYKKAKNSTLCF